MSSVSGGEEVYVHVYEVSKGMAAAFSTHLIGRRLEGVWHTGIVAYGKEYFFGGFGISSGIPGRIAGLGMPDERVLVGHTEVPYDLFMEYLNELATERFHGSKYHLFEHNCNNFSNEVAMFLTGNGIPEKIVNLPAEVLQTPFGQMLRPFIERMMNGGDPVTFNRLIDNSISTVSSSPMMDNSSRPTPSQPNRSNHDNDDLD